MILGVAIADFRQRSRGLGLTAWIAVALYAGVLLVPDRHAMYFVMDVGGSTGVFNSAWVAGVCSFLLVSLFGLLGIFPVRIAIGRDALHATDGIVASAPISRIHFVAGKWLSNVWFLSCISIALLVAAMVMQIVRHEVLIINIEAYVLDFVLIVLPAIVLVAAMAVLFETVALLRGIFGSVLFVCLFYLACIGLTRVEIGNLLYDPLGVGAILTSITSQAQSTFHLTDAAQSFIGATGKGPRLFVWQGLKWHAFGVLQRAFWLAIALFIVGLSAMLFDRFSRAWHVSKARVPAWRLRLWGTPLGVELPLLFCQLPRAWFLFAAGAAIFSAVSPIEIVARFGFPLCILFVLPAWASLGVAEFRNRTSELVASINGLNAGFCFSKWMAGSIFGWIVCSGFIVALFAHGQVAPGIACIAVIAALAAVAYLFGTLTRSPRAFEVAFIIVWFIGPMNGVAAFDFTISILRFPLTSIAVAGGVAMLAVFAVFSVPVSARSRPS